MIKGVIKTENFKIGDKVKILNVEKIHAAESGGYKNNGIYKVVEVDTYDGTPILEALEKFPLDKLCILKSELRYIELVK